MKTCIIIPVYNEQEHLVNTLNSWVCQLELPNKLIIVDDNSSDGSPKIIQEFVSKYSFIETVRNPSSDAHQPGAKVIHAFNKGLGILKNKYDLIGKFDADIILPENYLLEVKKIFESNAEIGIAGGNLYIMERGEWRFEAISEKTKVRGPIKLYRWDCLKAIGGLKSSIGWDTVDELLAQYHGWTIATNTSLKVKHLKPTGATYTKNSKFKQGEAFKRMRYQFWLTLIASAKLAARKKSFSFFWNCLLGYFKAGNAYIVSKEEGEFIRNLRWKNIKNKIFIRK